MAFTEEKEAGKNESKQSNNTDEILKIISNSESKRLDLSRRHIEDVPIEMKSLRKLEFLYLEGNSLTCLPDDFFTCLIQLKWLDLRNNHLTHLPVTIGESRCLRSLLLEDNKIKRLPLELGFVQSLTGLHLAGNPLEFPPQSIVEQGTQVLLAFLRDEWLKMQKEIDDHSECDEADKLEDNTVDEGWRIRNNSDKKGHSLERRSSDPSRFSSRLYEGEESPLTIASSMMSHPPGTRRRVKSYSANKIKERDRNSSALVLGGKSRNSEQSRKPKVMTHNMKRMSTGLLRAESAESKMQEEMRRAEEKIRNAKIYAIIQQRKNKQELDGWRKETQKLQRQKNLEAARKGLKYASPSPPFGTHDQKVKATTKHGEQVQDALENMDAASLANLNRDREIFDRINDHIKKLRSKKQILKKIPPMEEVEAARKNLEEALKLQSELEERRALEYRLRAFTAEDYAPPIHAKNRR